MQDVMTAWKDNRSFDVKAWAKNAEDIMKLYENLRLIFMRE